MSRTVFARLALYPFLAAVIACGFLSVEAWPFTAWKLFSQVRGPAQAGWAAVAVLAEDETPIDFASLGRGYTGALHLMIELPRRNEAQRAAVCDTWVTALRDEGHRLDGVRIYRTRSFVRRDEAVTPPVQRTLFYECGTS